MSIEYDAEGRIILPGSVAQDKEKEMKSIILERYQINVNNPAIAQLRIKLGPNLNVDKEAVIKKLHNFCENYISSGPSDVESELKLREDIVIVEAKSSKMMYSFLDNLIGDIRQVYSEMCNVVVKGSFAKGAW